MRVRVYTPTSWIFFVCCFAAQNKINVPRHTLRKILYLFICVFFSVLNKMTGWHIEINIKQKIFLKRKKKCFNKSGTKNFYLASAKNFITFFLSTLFHVWFVYYTIFFYTVGTWKKLNMNIYFKLRSLTKRIKSYKFDSN